MTSVAHANRASNSGAPLSGEYDPIDDAPFSEERKPLFYTGLSLVTLSLIFGLTTYLILTGLTPIPPHHNVVVTVLSINAILLVLMLILVAFHARELLRNHKKGKAGARLHVKFVIQFVIIAALPAGLLAVFASVSLNRGLDSLFSTHTKMLVSESLEVAQAYVREHSDTIRNDMVAVSSAIEKDFPRIRNDPEAMARALQAQSQLGALPSLYLITSDGRLIARGGHSPEAYKKPRAGYLGAAQDGTVIVIKPKTTNMIKAIKKLANSSDVYVYATRRINPVVIHHLMKAQENVSKYKKLDKGRSGVQVAFALMYLAIALTLILASIWMGLWFANRLSEPIRSLITAAQRVSEGDLDTFVSIHSHQGELEHLGSTFNNMTSEIKRQQKEARDNHEKMDERRQFTEAVLSGVSAGVIGLDVFGVVDHVNRSAQHLLSRQKDELYGNRLEKVIPEFDPIIDQAKRSLDQEKTQIHKDVDLTIDGIERHFAVRLTREGSEGREYGFVLTFDDTTELVKAQRFSAWADIARRMAHEIKNPLQPIQTATERLHRRYNRRADDDRRILNECTETILNCVGNIDRLVKDFSDFARMPEPEMLLYDLRDIVSDAQVMYEHSEDNTSVALVLPDSSVISMCDKGLISQALINLVKNAIEAIDAKRQSERGLENFQGHIEIALRTSVNDYRIDVTDNGCGLPKEQRNRLLDPYETTRKDGTGLGLAIVQKIAEQHDGKVLLEDASPSEKDETGARIALILPYKKNDGPKTETAPAASTDKKPRDADAKPNNKKETCHV